MKSLPVIFISGIVGWSYYAYVIALVLNAMNDNVAEQVNNNNNNNNNYKNNSNKTV